MEITLTEIMFKKSFKNSNYTRCTFALVGVSVSTKSKIEGDETRNDFFHTKLHKKLSAKAVVR